MTSLAHIVHHGVRAVAVLAALAVLPLGCGSLSKPYPEKSLHALDVGEPPADAAPAARSPLVMRVESVRVATPYDTTTFVYKTGPSTFANDYYSGFITEPSPMLTAALCAWLGRTGPFACTLHGASSADYQFSLETNVLALYGDYTPGKPPQAVIEARFFLVDTQKGQYHVTFHKTYRQTEPLAGTGPDALVEGWQKACRRMFTALVGDLQKAPVVAETSSAR